MPKFDLAKRAGFWSLQPIKPAAVPAGPAEQSPIDRFLASKLREAKLHFANPADRSTLLRRLSFDLTGLPPTPAELDAFLKDESADAYAKQVDRLLASPRFGEHWARHWLDLVRYAETMGHEFDFEMFEPWRYRDYVVRAFNEDVPYDQFLKEHLAGDLLPTPRINAKGKWNESILATAFWHLHEGKHSPVDIRQEYADVADNQIDVFGKTFLASTLACARCHDHKFDAITTRDYYSLMGVLESSRFAKGYIDDPAEMLPPLRKLQAERLARSGALRAELIPLLEKSKFPETADEPQNAGPNRMRELFGERRGSEESRYPGEGPAFAVSPVPGQLVRIENAWQIVGPDAVAAVIGSSRLPGSRRSKTFAIATDRIQLRAAGKGVQVRLVIEHFQIIKAPIYGGLEFNFNFSAGAAPAWHDIDTHMWKGRNAYLELVDSGTGSILLDDVRFADGPIREAPAKVDFRAALESWRNDKLAADPNASRSVDALNRALREVKAAGKPKDDEALDAAANAIPPSHRSMVLIEGTPQSERVFVRGNYKKLGEEAPHRLLEVLEEPVLKSGSGRLELAEGMVGPHNPLVRRVIVNRVWKHLFGEGLVRSVDDFGVQGERPSHPELLDWLAADFSQNGWSVKKLIRQIVSTEAYRQGSRSDADPAVDAQNRLLHRFPIKRIEAESIRDTMLYLAGRLDETREGPGVPPFLSPSMLGRGRPATSGPLDGNGRRSIYLQVRRNFPNPMLSAFDLPTPFTTIGRRSVSNVPSQALILLNNPLVNQLAGDWAKRAIRETPAETRIDRMYRMAFARPAGAEELALAREFLAEAAGETEEARWTALAHAMFNAKEFIFVP